MGGLLYPLNVLQNYSTLRDMLFLQHFMTFFFYVLRNLWDQICHSHTYCFEAKPLWKKKKIIDLKIAKNVILCTYKSNVDCISSILINIQYMILLSLPVSLEAHFCRSNHSKTDMWTVSLYLTIKLNTVYHFSFIKALYKKKKKKDF